MNEGKKKKSQKSKRNNPKTNLTLRPHVKEAAERYKKSPNGEPISALANRLLKEFLQKEGYLEKD